MVPVDVHGASSKTASNVLLRSPRRHVGADQLGFERQAGEIFLQPLEPRRRAIDRRDFGAGNNELRRLAAGRGAQIGDAQARDIAEKPRRDRGCCVLHPPRAFVETRQRGDGAMHDGAHRTGRQHAAVEFCRPSFGIGFHREIERRLAAIGGGDGMRGRLAVGLDPARHQPRRRIEHRRIERRDPLLAFARDPPQHRVDQAGKMQRLAILAREPHREIDRGMVGHFEKQNLRGTDQQRGLDPRRLRRRPLLEKRPEQIAQGAEPAQHDGNDRPRQPAVAIGRARQAPRSRRAHRSLRASRRAPGAD